MIQGHFIAMGHIRSETHTRPSQKKKSLISLAFPIFGVTQVPNYELRYCLEEKPFLRSGCLHNDTNTTQTPDGLISSCV